MDHRKFPDGKITVLILFLWQAVNAYAQDRYTISGFVGDSLSGEKLWYATVYDEISHKGVCTNEAGFFSLTLPPGRVRLNISYVNYQQQILDITLTSNTVLHINLSPKSLSEVVISADRSPIPRSIGGAHHLQMKNLERLPVMLGEPDIIKSLQLLPGIQSGSEGSVGINIRGGSSDQNLILLDGVPVYNISHAYGFFSIFNSDAINSATVYKGSFPARYGDRLSSVIDIRTREGNSKQFSGTASVSLVAARLTLEGPILNNKTSFIISARRSYLDMVAKKLFRNIFEYDNGNYHFYDVNVRLTHHFSGKSRLSGSFYSGNDKEDYVISSTFSEDIQVNRQNWGNMQGNLFWNYAMHPKWYLEAGLGYTRYRMLSEIALGNRDGDRRSDYRSSIEDLSARINLQNNMSPAHTVRFGLSFTSSLFTPSSVSTHIFEEDGRLSIDTITGNRNLRTGQLTFYAEDEINLSDQWFLNAGLRYSAYRTGGRTYHTIDPRLALLWEILPTLKIKAGYTSAHQFTHLLTAARINMQEDMWIPSTPDFKPQYGHQVSMGTERQFKDGWLAGVEFYYRNMYRILEYKDGASYTQAQTHWETELEEGKGIMYGIEFMIEKKQGKLTGWIAYTLSKSDRKFEKINNGHSFPFRYDRLHDIKIVADYKLSTAWNVSAAWLFNTGNHLTVALQKLDNNLLYYQRNAYQTPDYHRLDMAINYRKEKKKLTHIWSLEIYNAYNKKNVYSVQTVPSVTTVSGIIYELQKRNFLSCVPSISYRLVF